MMKLNFLLVCSLLFTGLSAGWMFDSGHLADLEINDDAAFAGSFSNINVYYVLQDGNTIIDESAEGFKNFRDGLHFFVRVFISPKGAQSYIDEMKSNQTGHTYTVQSVNMSRLIAMMLKTARKGQGNSLRNPSFVVFDNNNFTPLFPEYFFERSTGNYHTITVEGKTIIPVFLSSRESIAYEKTLSPEMSNKLTRVGKDILPILKIVSTTSTKKVKAIVLGYDAIKQLNTLQGKE